MGKIIAETTAGEKITLEGEYIVLPAGDYKGWEIIDSPAEIRFPVGVTVNCPKITITETLPRK